MYDELSNVAGTISIQDLVRFCEVAETGSIARAKRENTGNEASSTAYSRSLDKVQRALGFDLFESKRVDNYVRTDKGENLLTIARCFLASMNDVSEEVHEHNKRLVFLARDSIIQWLVSPCITEIKSQFSNYGAIRLHDYSSVRAIERVMYGGADFGVCRSEEVSEQKKLGIVELGSISFCLILGKSHFDNFEVEDKVDLFCKLPLVTLGGFSNFPKTVQERLKSIRESRSIHPESVVECDNFQQVMRIVVENKSLGLVPKSYIISNEDDFFILNSDWLLGKLEEELSLIYSKERLKQRCIDETMVHWLSRMFSRRLALCENEVNRCVLS